MTAPCRRSHRLALVALVAAGVTLPHALLAQRADSTSRGARAPRADSTARPVPRAPITPRRAFLYSLALPGYGQSRLGRPSAGALFVLTETIAIAMLRESRAELNEARLLRMDSLTTIGVDPQTGTRVTQRAAFGDELIETRRAHVEDWVAFLIANHLFAGADAYVAAHLWDLPSQVSVRQTSRGTTVAARIRW